jgi:isoaspartyl peptidase/L-asparaginase-like protein (Ntn-hydrolase superfamily)
VATGVGELMMRTCSAVVAVEAMRAGADPSAACRLAMDRVVAMLGGLRAARRRAQDPAGDFQCAMVAINRAGGVGHYALRPGFQFAYSLVDTDACAFGTGAGTTASAAAAAAGDKDATLYGGQNWLEDSAAPPVALEDGST